MTANDEILLKAFEIYSKDEEIQIQSLQGYLKFFSSIIVAITGGIFFLMRHKVIQGGITSAANNTPGAFPELVEIMGFVIAGILIIGLAIIGYKIAWAHYRRQLESILKRSTIEDRLKFSSHMRYPGYMVRPKQPIMLKRHLDDLEVCSEEKKPGKGSTNGPFVDTRLKKGILKNLRTYYLLMGLIGGILILLGIFNIWF